MSSATLDPQLYTGHPWERELRADNRAGSVLALLGARSDDFITFLRQHSRTTDTHPPIEWRVDAVVSGYFAMIPAYRVAA